MAIRVAVVGGSSGIGEAVALRLVRQGAQVVVGGRRELTLAEAQRRMGGNVRAEVIDAMDSKSVERFFEKTGPLDHLVICVSGRKGSGLFKDLSLDDLRDGFAEKTLAQLRIAQAGLKRLTPDGSITFITASSGRTAVAGGSGLGAINGALDVMVPSLALELAPLRVNAVAPGVVDTQWWDGVPAELKTSYFEQAAATLPVRKVGQPDHVAAAVEMLLHNSYITGTVLEVDGGHRLV